jgi:hypothetical protein
MIRLPDGFGLTPAGSAVAVVIALLAMLPFARALRRGGLGIPLFAALGGALFLVAVLVVQVRAQAALASLVTNRVSPFWLGDHVWALPVALALVAALLQEGGRLGALALGTRVAPPRISLVAAGAVVGGGVGLVEAAMVLGAIPPAAFHPLSIAVLERVGAVAFHVGAGAVIGAGVARGRTWAGFALAVVVHWLIDSVAATFQVGLVSLAQAEAVSLVAGLAMLALGALALRAKSLKAPTGAHLSAL